MNLSLLNLSIFQIICMVPVLGYLLFIYAYVIGFLLFGKGWKVDKVTPRPPAAPGRSPVVKK